MFSEFAYKWVEPEHTEENEKLAKYVDSMMALNMFDSHKMVQHFDQD